MSYSRKNFINGEKTVNMNYQWPMIFKYKVLQNDRYGMRECNYDIFKPLFHFGFDITADIGTPVNPVMPGVVTFVGLDVSKDETGKPIYNTKYGRKIEILQKDGNISAYGHLSAFNVSIGDIVDYDTIIAYSGCSGAARIPHLHFEIRKGNVAKGTKDTTYNPEDILPYVDFSQYGKNFTSEPYNHLWNILNSNNPYSFTRDDIWWENDEEFIR